MRIKRPSASILLLAVSATPALAQEPRSTGSVRRDREVDPTGHRPTDEQLKTLLPAQERAIAIDARLKKAIGEQYGLSYFDSKSEKLIVNVADDELAKQVEAAGPAPNFVKHDLRELAAGILIGLGGPDTASRKREIVKSGPRRSRRSRSTRSATRWPSRPPRSSPKGRAGSGRQVRRGRGVREHPERAKGDRVHGRRRWHQRQLLSAGFNLRKPSRARATCSRPATASTPATRCVARATSPSTPCSKRFPSYDDSMIRGHKSLVDAGPVGGHQPVQRRHHHHHRQHGCAGRHDRSASPASRPSRPAARSRQERDRPLLQRRDRVRPHPPLRMRRAR